MGPTGQKKKLKQQLVAHISAAYREIEQLKEIYRLAIGRLEQNTRNGLSIRGLRQWFQMYLRLVDLGVEIRRGEIRHRTQRQFHHPCMHTTGTKGALHSGLSIDDANGIYQRLEQGALVSESRLETFFMRMDALDRDDVGVLDVRLNDCLEKLRRTKSGFYTRVEVNGSDPHQELLVFSPKAAGSTESVEKITRVCFNPSTCKCAEDAEPWTEFEIPVETVAPSIASSSINSGGSRSTQVHSSAVSTATDSDKVDDVGLMDLKRQFGFEPLVQPDDDDEMPGYDKVDLNKRCRLAGTNGLSRGMLTTSRQTPRELYLHKCHEYGIVPNKKILSLFAVKNGSITLNLDNIGFYSPDNFHDIVDIAKAAQIPIHALEVANKFFSLKSFEVLCQCLHIPSLRQHIQKINFRCLALPQRSSLATILRSLADPSLHALDQLQELDLSHNTMSTESTESLHLLVTRLPRLERLSLASCFPCHSGAVDEQMIRTTIATCCNHLKILDFGSNSMHFSLLNTLFAPESALQKLVIKDITVMPSSNELANENEMLDLNFQHLQSLTISESQFSTQMMYWPELLDQLIYNLKTGFVQLKHLDIDIRNQRIAGETYNESRLDMKVTELLEQLGEYGMLSSLRLCYNLSNQTIDSDLNSTFTQKLTHLLSRGLGNCETLTLDIGLRFSIPSFLDLLSNSDLSKVLKMKLSVALVGSDEEILRPYQSFTSAFQSTLASDIQELTLEFRVPLCEGEDILRPAYIEEIKEFWLTLGTSQRQQQTDSTTNQRLKREFFMSKRKINRYLTVSFQAFDEATTPVEQHVIYMLTGTTSQRPNP